MTDVIGIQWRYEALLPIKYATELNTEPAVLIGSSIKFFI